MSSGFHPLEALFGGREHMYQMKPLTDIVELGDHQIAYIELPGVAKSDLDISLVDNTLTVTANLRKPADFQNDKASFLNAERRYGTLKRSFTVAHGITEEDVKARMEQGLLRIEVPKRGKGAEHLAKRIQVA